VARITPSATDGTGSGESTITIPSMITASNGSETQPKPV